MKLAIMQPYLFPYIGYFQLMKAVDKYIIYDDVNYIKGGWVNRNNIIVNNEKKIFTITLKGASPNRLFNEIEIGDNFNKLIKTLQLNYSKAPYFESTMDLLREIISFPDKRLSNFISNSFREILDYLDINTELINSSSIQKDCQLRGKDKVINICKILGAETYYNAIGGKELYDKDEFNANGIELHFIDSKVSSYKQMTKQFIPNLSIIDVLMNNSKSEINILMDQYVLV